jgi:hypothetical protein
LHQQVKNHLPASITRCPFELPIGCTLIKPFSIGYLQSYDAVLTSSTTILMASLPLIAATAAAESFSKATRQAGYSSKTVRAAYAPIGLLTDLPSSPVVCSQASGEKKTGFRLV